MIVMMVAVLELVVEATKAEELVLKNNIVAGCERMGYHLPGQDCSTPTGEFIMVVVVVLLLLLLLMIT